MNYLKFKSGSDIRGYALGDENNPLFMTDDMIIRTTAAFCAFLSRKTGKNELKISVGHDCRLSAPRIKSAVISALMDLNVHIIDCSLSSTPAMFMTTVKLGCDGAVQITASHHPKDRNGLKFFTKEGGLEGSEIEEILNLAQNINSAEGANKGTLDTCDFMSDYAGMLKSMIIDGTGGGVTPLKGLKIIVDAGNGVGGFYADKVLKPLGADTDGSLYLEPDGNFPNHAPNPENADAMKCITDAVIKTRADFGIIFDTDVDRAACVGKGGVSINRNRLVALAAQVSLENTPGGTIVTDSVTSDGLSEFIKNIGGKHLRFKRGYKNVIDKQIELEKHGIKTPLAIETSGHAAFSENYYLDDGAYLITKLIIKIAELSKKGKSLDSLIAGLKEPKEEKELRFKIEADDFRKTGQDVIDFVEKQSSAVKDWTACDDNYEGIRINSENGDGWFLLRLSVHDPIMVLNCESNKVGGVKTICKELYNVLKGCPSINLLNINTLKEFAGE